MNRPIRSRMLTVLAAIAVLSAVGFTVAAWNAGLPSEKVPAPVVAVAPASQIVDAPSACDESWTLDYTPAARATETFLADSSAQGCKNCKDRTWCKCSYNGLPRVSCNPCCYGNLGIPQVCLD